MHQQDSQVALTQEQTNKVMVWAITTPAFTLDMLTGQIQRLRSYATDSAKEAKKLINQWKKAGKIKFARGHWKWQI